MRRRRQPVRDSQFSSGLPIGQSGHPDSRRGLVFDFQLRLRAIQRTRSDQLCERPIRRMHDCTLLQNRQIHCAMLMSGLRWSLSDWPEQSDLLAGWRPRVVSRLCAASLTDSYSSERTSPGVRHCAQSGRLRPRRTGQRRMPLVRAGRHYLASQQWR